MAISLPDAITAISGLGTASFALVDATKSLEGGVSNLGFGQIVRLLDHLFPENVDKKDTANAITYGAIRATLRANWLNGMAAADQKSIAKTLLKLRLDPANATLLAQRTSVDPETLTSLARKYATGLALTAEEQNVAGRFDLLLATLLDQAYQRADQIYRNSAKALAVIFSVALAAAAKLSMADINVDWGTTVLAGLLAAPLAPVSKDLTSALQASVKTLQFFRK